MWLIEAVIEALTLGNEDVDNTFIYSLKKLFRAYSLAPIPLTP